MYRIFSVVVVLCFVCFPSAVGANGEHVYWTDVTGADSWQSTIKRANDDGSNITTLVSGLNHSRGMALDLQSGKMYWATPFIYRANLDGSGPVVLSGTSGGGGGIAIDAQGGKMYWTDSVLSGTTRYGSIYRANLDGSNSETIVPVTAGLQHPVGIALDVSHNKVYWTDLEGNYDGQGEIWRADLDGSNMAAVLTGIDEANGLAIDVSGGKLYWPEVVTKKIQCANLDGSGLTDLITGLNLPTTIALDLSEGKMYWTDTDGVNSSNSRIERANLDGSDVETILSGVGLPWGIAVAPVPEPSTIVMLGMGAMSLLAYAWRRCKRMA